jgi:hypothetical protein
LEFAKELIPIADLQIAELSRITTELPSRPSVLPEDDGSAPFLAPLHEYLHGFIKYYEERDRGPLPSLGSFGEDR